MKLDPDVKQMSPAELRKEVMRLRSAFRRELKSRGNHRCWVTLLKALPEGGKLEPLELPETEFLTNCKKYFRRNANES